MTGGQNVMTEGGTIFFEEYTDTIPKSSEKILKPEIYYS